MAVAIAASTAFPPSASIRRPAWAASGCEVHTALAARMGVCGHAYGKVQPKGEADPADEVTAGSLHVAAAGSIEVAGSRRAPGLRHQPWRHPGQLRGQLRAPESAVVPPGENPPAGGFGS